MFKFAAAILFAATTAHAAVDVEQFQVVRATFTDEEAQQWTQAFGLREVSTQKAPLESMRGARVEAAVSGTYSANGNVKFSHHGLVQLISPKIENTTATTVLLFNDARQLYEAMKGISEVTVKEDTLEREITLGNVQVLCRYFLPKHEKPHHACRIAIGL